jgi:truncated hemoglobin YjbI
MLIERGIHHPIARIQDTWRIDDEWWRDLISRRYYVLVLHNDTLRTVYQNLVDGQWYEQRY